MFEVIKKFVFWTYPRGSWQYDIFCALILCFIFLTPRAVFDGSAFFEVPDQVNPATEAEENEDSRASLKSVPDERETQDDEQPGIFGSDTR